MRSTAFAILAVGALLCSVSDVHSCQCSKRAPFLETVAGSELVVRGEIAAYGERHVRDVEVYESLVLRVTETLKGATGLKEIVIRGGDGKNCILELYPMLFEVGGEYVFSVKALDGGEYRLQSCGESWLRISEGVVRGSIAIVEQSSMTYEELVIRVAGVGYQPQSSQKR